MSSVTELLNIFDKVSQFFRDKYAYLSTGSGGPLISDITSLNYTELLTYVCGEAQGPAGFEVGAAQEGILTAAAISRESDMAVLSKSEIYSNCSSESQTEADFYASSSSYFGGVLSGTPTNGSRS